MKSLYLNHNGFFEFCKGYGESKTIKFPFNFSRLPPAPPPFFKDKEIFGFARSGGRTEAIGVCALTRAQSLPKTPEARNGTKIRQNSEILKMRAISCWNRGRSRSVRSFYSFSRY